MVATKSIHFVAFLLFSIFGFSSGIGDPVNKKFILKTSTIPAMNLFGSMLRGDIGLESSLFRNVTIDADIGYRYRSAWHAENPDMTSSGHFAGVALRKYSDHPDTTIQLFWGLQYIYGHRKSDITLDFSGADMLYQKDLVWHRRSNIVNLIAGCQLEYFVDWLVVQYYFGCGIDYRFSSIEGLTDFEREAVESQFLPKVADYNLNRHLFASFTFGAKAGFNFRAIGK
jgi:hypothetical protein